MYSLKGIRFKGEIKKFPHPVVHEMMLQQEMQGNVADHEAFEERNACASEYGGFDWDSSTQGGDFWVEVISNENFKYFFDCKQNEMKTSFAKYHSSKPAKVEEPKRAKSATVVKSSPKPLKSLSKGDIVYVSDLDESDAIKYQSKRVFLRKTSEGNLCTDLNSWNNSNGNESEITRTSTWTYAVLTS